MEKIINIEEAKQEFFNYANNYNTKDSNIDRKIGHSIRVMELSKKIATNLNLTKEQIDLATLIGLLHDIGRFEQYTIEHNYRELGKIDHGKLGVEILKKDEYIRKYIKTDKFDNIIFKAILNHNQYGLEKNLSEEELLFCKLIKDSDKLDIFYEVVNLLFWHGDKHEVEKGTITPIVYETFMYDKRLIENKMKQNQTDRLVSIISFIYDINYTESFKILKQEDYLKRIIETFNFEDKKTRKQMEEIQKIADDYIVKN